MAKKKIIRVVTRAADGSFRTKDYSNFDDLLGLHEQTGIDDCSTDLALRGLPLFKGLVGPFPEDKTIARYESPDVFESLTKQWASAKSKRKRRSSTNITTGSDATTTTQQNPSTRKPNFLPMPGAANTAPAIVSSNNT